MSLKTPFLQARCDTYPTLASNRAMNTGCVGFRVIYKNREAVFLSNVSATYLLMLTLLGLRQSRFGDKLLRI